MPGERVEAVCAGLGESAFGAAAARESCLTAELAGFCGTGAAGALGWTDAVCWVGRKGVSTPQAVTIRRPSGLKEASRTGPGWPIAWPRGMPLSASHERAVVSPLAVTMRRPSGLKAAFNTGPWWRIAWPNGLPVWPSHWRAVASRLAVSTRRPAASGLKRAR